MSEQPKEVTIKEIKEKIDYKDPIPEININHNIISKNTLAMNNMRFVNFTINGKITTMMLDDLIALSFSRFDMFTKGDKNKIRNNFTSSVIINSKGKVSKSLSEKDSEDQDKDIAIEKENSIKRLYPIKSIVACIDVDPNKDVGGVWKQLSKEEYQEKTHVIDNTMDFQSYWIRVA